jgi:hypothetical protein
MWTVLPLSLGLWLQCKGDFDSVKKETINKNVDLHVTNCLIRLAAFVKEKAPEMISN